MTGDMTTASDGGAPPLTDEAVPDLDVRREAIDRLTALGELIASLAALEQVLAAQIVASLVALNPMYFRAFRLSPTFIL